MGIRDTLKEVVSNATTSAVDIAQAGSDIAQMGTDMVREWQQDQRTYRADRNRDRVADEAAQQFGNMTEEQAHARSAGIYAATDQDVIKAILDEHKALADRNGSRDPLGGLHEPANDPKAVQFDPFDMVAITGWRERPSGLSYRALARVAAQTPVIADIIRTRIQQVIVFCALPNDRHSPGFKVRLRDRDAEMTPEIEKRCREYETVILNCGFEHPDRPSDSTSFAHFAKMFIRDSLTYDQACFEKVPDKLGRPAYFKNVDSATIRLLDPFVRDDEGILAVQMLRSMIVADFTSDEIAFCIRNPRSGIHTYGYGEAEIATLIREITGFLWSMQYNRKFFSQGSAAKGILNFKGMIPDRHMAAFRRQWTAMVSGVTNAWKTPITNAEGLEWINMQLTNRDMEYSAWMDFLIKICCARFLIAPEEVNFSYGNTGQVAAMGGTSTEEKLKASKDLGLRPLVHFLFESINRNFLWDLDPLYEVVPVGLDEKGVEAETELLEKQTKVWMTVNEARRFAGEEPLPGKQGDVILNDVWLRHVEATEQAEQPANDSEQPVTTDAETEAGTEDDTDPTGGLGQLQYSSGEPFQFVDDVAKSLTNTLQSNRRRNVRRYEAEI